MLVLTRRLNESIVIDGIVEIYVVGISADNVDLVILGSPDIRVRRCTVQFQETIEIVAGVTLIPIEIRESQTRLGIDAPRETTIHRGEFTS